MQRTDTKITRYRRGHFFIDIVEMPNEFEAWLTHDCYGVSTLMFGTYKTKLGTDTETEKEFLELVESNLPEYIDDFRKTYIY